MSNFEVLNGVLRRYTGNEKEVIVPNNVLEIGVSAFCESTSLEKITFPRGLKKIGGAAFYNCRALKEITFHEGPLEIGENAFLYCKGLVSLVLPEGLKEISSGVFKNCTSLTSVVLPRGLEKIGWNSFCGCTALTKIDLPKSLLKIGWKAFYNCVSLESISLPRGLEEIERSAFSGCKGLRKIKIPKEFDKDVAWYKGKFDWETVVPIALEYLDKDTRVVKHLCEYAKETIDTLVKKNRTDLVTNLLEISPKIDLATLNDLIDYAHKYSDTVITANLLDYKNKNYTQSQQNELDSDQLDKMLGIKEMTLKDYERIFRLREENGEYTIQIHELKREITEIVIPNMINGKKITKIENNAFKDCKDLSSIILPKGLKSIGESAFCGCISLENIALPSGLLEIGTLAFAGCQRLTGITLPKKLKKIGGFAFSSCPSLKIYCKEEKKPKGWDEKWNPDNLPVAWKK